MTLVKGDLRGIAFAFGYNALGIPVAGVLYPAFGLLLSPIFTGAAMALSSVLFGKFRDLRARPMRSIHQSK